MSPLLSPWYTVSSVDNSTRICAQQFALKTCNITYHDVVPHQDYLLVNITDESLVLVINKGSTLTFSCPNVSDNLVVGYSIK